MDNVSLLPLSMCTRVKSLSTRMWVLPSCTDNIILSQFVQYQWCSLMLLLLAKSQAELSSQSWHFTWLGGLDALASLWESCPHPSLHSVCGTRRSIRIRLFCVCLFWHTVYCCGDKFYKVWLKTFPIIHLSCSSTLPPQKTDSHRQVILEY